MSERKCSERLFAEAKKCLAGGVNSPVRAYRDMGFAPPFIAKAAGSHIWDADGNEYIDYVASWGPMILGHAHPAVIAAIKEALDAGTSFGAPTERETELAILVKRAFPSIELVRFVSSGTEAAMSAIRVARGYTGRAGIIKFNGCYHGHADHLLVRAGSGAATFSEPDSGGVPSDFAKHTLVAEYNDLDGVNAIVKTCGDIAAIIVEPVAGNMGCVPPEPGFLEGLRDICDRHGIILIFDEVITGFRLACGGAQELYGIKADLTCLGKILGGGLPMGGYGGRKDIMEMVSPLGPVYQAGTLSGNPIAVAAGIATLKELSANVMPQSYGGKDVGDTIVMSFLRPFDRLRVVSEVEPKQESSVVTRFKTPDPRSPIVVGDKFRGDDDRVDFPREAKALSASDNPPHDLYQHLDRMTDHLTAGLSNALSEKDIPHTVNRVGSMFSVFFTPKRVTSFKDAAKADRAVFKKYFTHMLENGIYLVPSQFESAFVGTAHTETDIEKTVEAAGGIGGKP